MAGAAVVTGASFIKESEAITAKPLGVPTVYINGIKVKAVKGNVFSKLKKGKLIIPGNYNI